MSGLSEGELRDLLDVDCDCGHGPDDHGSELFGCHLCPDYDEPRECPRSFLSLLAERLNGWADAREAWRGEVDGLRARVEALADEWDTTVYKLAPGYPMSVNEFCRYWFKAPLREALGAPHARSEARERDSYAWPTNGSGK